jgi:hypothetical protein
MEAEDEDSAEVVDLDQMTLAVARLRRGNVQQAALEAKVKEYEDAARERAEKKIALTQTLEKEEKRGGITPETRALIDQELGALG